MPPTTPSLRALLRRDHPARTFGAFTAIFGLGTIVGLAWLIIAGEPVKADVAIGVATFGLFAVGVGLVFLRRLLWIVGLTRRGIVVDGTVRRNEPNSEEIYFLEVDYELQGTQHRITQGTGTKTRFAPGDTVALLVDPERPTRAWIADR